MPGAVLLFANFTHNRRLSVSMCMLLFFFHTLVSIICSCTSINLTSLDLCCTSAFHVLPPQGSYSSHSAYVSVYIAGFGWFLCDLCFNILPYISLRFQHYFPFMVNTFIIKHCIDPIHCKRFRDISVQWLDIFHCFILPCCLCFFALLISHITCHSDLRVLINIFDTLHPSPFMFNAHIQPFITGLHAVHLCLSQFLLYYFI